METTKTKQQNKLENIVTIVTALIFGSVLLNGLYLALTNLF